MEIRIANECDIDDWMNLVSKVKNSFPGLETKEALDEHRDTVLDFIRNESAICARIEDKTVGVLLFSKDNSMLCLGFVPGRMTVEFGSEVQEFVMDAAQWQIF